APGPPADLTGDGFVDFQDLTILLAHWDQMVSAGQGNLVDPLSTPINFQDLTFLLAAWTGPGGAASPQAAAVVGGESYRRRDRRATDLVIGEMRDGSATGVASYRARRAETRSRPLGGIYRLQAVAVDRAMGEEAFPLLRRARPARR
ncbi:MAG: hypothetical protein IIA67_00345, partial [Planctomycetes bacterium]|nr:hypothetical protein [Planctomycetota bacterium]